MDSSESSTSVASGLARLFWMMVGPATLFILAYAMVTQRAGWFSGTSLAFLVILALVLVARRMDPLDGEGEPAPPEAYRRHLTLFLPLGIGLWLVANWVGNHWLAS